MTGKQEVATGGCVWGQRHARRNLKLPEKFFSRPLRSVSIHRSHAGRRHIWVRQTPVNTFITELPSFKKHQPTWHFLLFKSFRKGFFVCELRQTQESSRSGLQVHLDQHPVARIIWIYLVKEKKTGRGTVGEITSFSAHRRHFSFVFLNSRPGVDPWWTTWTVDWGTPQSR